MSEVMTKTATEIALEERIEVLEKDNLRLEQEVETLEEDIEDLEIEVRELKQPNRDDYLIEEALQLYADPANWTDEGKLSPVLRSIDVTDPYLPARRALDILDA